MVLLPPPKPIHMESGRDEIIITQIVGIQTLREMPGRKAPSLLISHQEAASERSNMSLEITTRFVARADLLHAPFADGVQVGGGQKPARVVGQFHQVLHEMMVSGNKQHRQS